MQEPVSGPEAGGGCGGKGGLGKAETQNAERAIANSSQTGKAANRLDEVKGRMPRSTPVNGCLGRFHGGFHAVIMTGIENLSCRINIRYGLRPGSERQHGRACRCEGMLMDASLHIHCPKSTRIESRSESPALQLLHFSPLCCLLTNFMREWPQKAQKTQIDGYCNPLILWNLCFLWPKFHRLKFVLSLSAHRWCVLLFKILKAYLKNA